MVESIRIYITLLGRILITTREGGSRPSLVSLFCHFVCVCRSQWQSASDEYVCGVAATFEKAEVERVARRATRICSWANQKHATAGPGCMSRVGSCGRCETMAHKFTPSEVGWSFAQPCVEQCFNVPALSFGGTHASFVLEFGLTTTVVHSNQAETALLSASYFCQSWVHSGSFILSLPSKNDPKTPVVTSICIIAKARN